MSEYYHLFKYIEEVLLKDNGFHLGITMYCPVNLTFIKGIYQHNSLLSIDIYEKEMYIGDREITKDEMYELVSMKLFHKFGFKTERILGFETKINKLLKK